MGLVGAIVLLAVVVVPVAFVRVAAAAGMKVTGTMAARVYTKTWSSGCPENVEVLLAASVEG